MAHINDLPFLKDAQVALSILSSCVSLSFLSHLDNLSFLFLPISFDKFEQENYVGMWGHYGFKVMGIYYGSLMGHQAQLLVSFGGIGFLFMDNYTPSTFLGSLVLVALYLCCKFLIFNESFWKSMFLRLKEATPPSVMPLCSSK
jgi:hypothetical protein